MTLSLLPRRCVQALLGSGLLTLAKSKDPVERRSHSSCGRNVKDEVHANTVESVFSCSSGR